MGLSLCGSRPFGVEVLVAVKGSFNLAVVDLGFMTDGSKGSLISGDTTSGVVANISTDFHFPPLSATVGLGVVEPCSPTKELSFNDASL